MNRGRTRTTRKPSTVSSADSVRSCWDVTTVTSCPRRASSLESDRTWLSTPPKCGENQRDTWAIRTPVTSEDPAPRRDVSPRVGPRAEEGLFSDDGTRVDRRVDAHLHVVPHDHAKLPQSGVDLDPAEHDLHGRLVEYFAHQCRAGIHLAVRRTLQGSQQRRVGPQEIPRSSDVDPFRRKTESIDVALRHQETNRVRDLEFAAGRFRGRVDEGEDVLVEHVDARIDQVRFRLPRFFLEGRDLLVLHLHHTEGTWIRDFRQGHDRPAHLPMER